MLPTIQQHFSNITKKQVEDIYEIMTDSLNTETLLFVAMISNLSRFVAGEKEDAGFGFGPGIRLSALSKDKTYKMQSNEMELLHDVVVELPMAGRNFNKYQEYIAKEFGATAVRYHSCGEAIVSLKDVDRFFDACASEQKLRTLLDWETETIKNVPVSHVLENGIYTTTDAHIASKCFEVANEAICIESEAVSPRASFVGLNSNLTVTV
jgi:hypothetical protein